MAWMAGSAWAASFGFSYGQEGQTSFIGYGKAETYDVAILVDNPSLRGAAIESVSVPLPGGDDIKDASAWISTDLSLKRVNGKYVNAPDVAQASGTVADGVLTVRFDTPHTIDGPMYVGYSFTVTELNETTSRPVAVKGGARSGGLYLHSSRTKMKWGDYSAAENAVSDMTVTLTGDLADHAAAFRSVTGLCGASDRDLVLTVPLENHGLRPIDTVTYDWTLGDFSGSGTLTLPCPIDGGWGHSCDVELNLGHVAVTGDCSLTLSVTAVGGQSNADPAPATDYCVKMYPFIPVRRPLVEEYTGLWCGYCPAGYVAMETMRDNYHGRFIGLVYHSGDDMSCDYSFPSSPGEYPAMYIDREQDISAKQVYTLWPELAAVFVGCDIDVDVEWADDDRTAVRAKAKVRFVEDEDRADYSISYALVADGLSDPEWLQTNYYSGRGGENLPEMQGVYGRLFTGGASKVRGLTFNDVVLALPYPDGVPGSIPSQVVAGEVMEHSFVFNLNDVRSTKTKDNSIIQDRDRLRVVASVIDNRTGRPVNSNTSLDMAGRSGIGSVDADFGDVVSTEWYDLGGRRLRQPGCGLHVRIDTMSDGTRRARKVMF